MNTSEKLKAIQEIISQDLGNRGIEKLVEMSALENSCVNLSASTKIIVMSGFCVPPITKCETDGPLGAINICEALVLLGKSVYLISDKYCIPTFKHLAEKVGLTEKEELFKIIEVPIDFSKEQAHKLLIEIRPDHLLALERPGLGKDGVACNMGGIPCSDINATLDHLFDYPEPPKELKTTCVGDGGNELGFGKKYELVKKHVPKGEKIGCITEADEVVVCGVSNWGGFGISAGLCLLNDGKLEEYLWDKEKHVLLMKEMINMGCVDGCTQKVELTVDGMEFSVHEGILRKIEKVCVE